LVSFGVGNSIPCSTLYPLGVLGISRGSASAKFTVAPITQTNLFKVLIYTNVKIVM
jgi:hypothetical protein